MPTLQQPLEASVMNRSGSFSAILPPDLYLELVARHGSRSTYGIGLRPYALTVSLPSFLVQGQDDEGVLGDVEDIGEEEVASLRKMHEELKESRRPLHPKMELVHTSPDEMSPASPETKMRRDPRTGDMVPYVPEHGVSPRDIAVGVPKSPDVTTDDVPVTKHLPGEGGRAKETNPFVGKSYQWQLDPYGDRFVVEEIMSGELRRGLQMWDFQNWKKYTLGTLDQAVQVADNLVRIEKELSRNPESTSYNGFNIKMEYTEPGSLSPPEGEELSTDRFVDNLSGHLAYLVYDADDHVVGSTPTMSEARAMVDETIQPTASVHHYAAFVKDALPKILERLDVYRQDIEQLGVVQAALVAKLEHKKSLGELNVAETKIINLLTDPDSNMNIYMRQVAKLLGELSTKAQALNSPSELPVKSRETLVRIVQNFIPAIMPELKLVLGLARSMNIVAADEGEEHLDPGRRGGHQLWELIEKLTPAPESEVEPPEIFTPTSIQEFFEEELFPQETGLFVSHDDIKTVSELSIKWNDFHNADETLESFFQLMRSPKVKHLSEISPSQEFVQAYLRGQALKDSWMSGKLSQKEETIYRLYQGIRATLGWHAKGQKPLHKNPVLMNKIQELFVLLDEYNSEVNLMKGVLDEMDRMHVYASEEGDEWQALEEFGNLVHRAMLALQGLSQEAV